MTPDHRFNPIAPTLMKRALQTMLTKHFKDMSHKQSGIQPSKEIMDIIVESSNGDIRSAIMALQFASISNHRGSFSSVGRARIKSKKSSGAMGGRVLLEAVTRREQSLALFHLIGKLLYNKRRALLSILSRLVNELLISGKGDPPSTSASKKDIQRDNDLDAKLKDPPKLPRHLREHQRRTSRVDVEVTSQFSVI